MALISCSECGGKVSEAAAACPHCGHPITAVEPANVEAVAPTTRTTYAVLLDSYEGTERDFALKMMQDDVITYESLFKARQAIKHLPAQLATRLPDDAAAGLAHKINAIGGRARVEPDGASVQVDHDGSVSAGRRKEILADSLNDAAAQAVAAKNRFSIQSQSDYEAVYTITVPPSHVFHLVMTLITFGLWFLFWVFAAVRGGQKSTHRVTVDQLGQLHTTRLS